MLPNPHEPPVTKKYNILNQTLRARLKFTRLSTLHIMQTVWDYLHFRRRVDCRAYDTNSMIEKTKWDYLHFRRRVDCRTT
jgi:hypothetical protein